MLSGASSCRTPAHDHQLAPVRSSSSRILSLATTATRTPSSQRECDRPAEPSWPGDERGASLSADHFSGLSRSPARRPSSHLRRETARISGDLRPNFGPCAPDCCGPRAAWHRSSPRSSTPPGACRRDEEPTRRIRSREDRLAHSRNPGDGGSRHAGCRQRTQLPACTSGSTDELARLVVSPATPIAPPARRPCKARAPYRPRETQESTAARCGAEGGTEEAK